LSWKAKKELGDMEKIKYYYSAMSKQVFILLLGLLFAIRFILLVQVTTYNINGYGENLNIGATLILYLVYLCICIFFFIAYKFFFTVFDEERAIYYNKLLRKEIEVDLNKVKRAHLTKKGIYLYGEGSERPIFYLPFFRWGVISPVGVDNFYKVLKEKKIKIEKDFTVLPGHGRRWKWVSIMYTCLALFTLGSATQALSLVVAIFKSH